ELDLDPLQVGLEEAFADAGDFAAHATEVFRFAAAGVMVAADRLLAANRTLHSHETEPHVLWKGVNIAASHSRDKIRGQGCNARGLHDSDHLAASRSPRRPQPPDARRKAHAWAP